MGFFRNVKHDPINQATYGLAFGVTHSPFINDIRPLGLETFGFVVSLDSFINCPSVSTSYSSCPNVSTSYSACPTINTSWSLK